ncbi:MAG: inositol monophosphatase, partial [Planctomycetota bacterium]|nr:inositol monophosphatase [Planctomycetota bacterium]
MTDDKMKVADDLAFVIELAGEAAKLALKARASVRPREKDNLSYVTDLDLDLERFIRGRLGERF